MFLRLKMIHRVISEPIKIGKVVFPDIVSTTDFHPFGMPMPSRTFTGNGYRFGYNTQESDAEISGSWGTHYTAQYWMYDSRLGRRWNLDPVDQISISNYATFANNPIANVDPDGNKFEFANSTSFSFRIKATFYIITGTLLSKNFRKNVLKLHRDENIHTINDVKNFGLRTSSGYSIPREILDYKSLPFPTPVPEGSSTDEYDKKIEEIKQHRDDYHDNLSFKTEKKYGGGDGSYIFLDLSRSNLKKLRNDEVSIISYFGHEFKHSDDISEGKGMLMLKRFVNEKWPNYAEYRADVFANAVTRDIN